jgi:hypothetical protein
MRKKTAFRQPHYLQVLRAEIDLIESALANDRFEDVLRGVERLFVAAGELRFAIAKHAYDNRLLTQGRIGSSMGISKQAVQQWLRNITLLD